MVKNEYLIISETVFCDVETNNNVLDVYYQRLKLCLKSISRLDKSGFDHIHALYISADKKSYIDKIRSFLYENEIECVQLIEYSHPQEGYKKPDSDHVDLRANPNRVDGLRDRLFNKIQIDSMNYKGFLRTAIDDDDIWAKSHLKNMLTAAHLLRCFVSEKALIGGGVTSLYLAKTQEQEVYLSEVVFDRAVCGNKFYFSQVWDKISKWSPWSIPDLISYKTAEKFKKLYDIDLFSLDGVQAGFYYFRRGTNLSSQNKNWCTREVLNEECLNSETEVVNHAENRRELTTVNIQGESSKHDFTLIDKSIRKLFFKTPAISKSIFKDLKFAYYIYCNGSIVKKLGYSPRAEESFVIPESLVGEFEVVSFIKFDSEVTARIKSKKIKV